MVYMPFYIPWLNLHGPVAVLLRRIAGDQGLESRLRGTWWSGYEATYIQVNIG